MNLDEKQKKSETSLGSFCMKKEHLRPLLNFSRNISAHHVFQAHELNCNSILGVIC